MVLIPSIQLLLHHRVYSLCILTYEDLCTIGKGIFSRCMVIRNDKQIHDRSEVNYASPRPERQNVCEPFTRTTLFEPSGRDATVRIIRVHPFACAATDTRLNALSKQTSRCMTSDDRLFTAKEHAYASCQGALDSMINQTSFMGNHHPSREGGNRCTRFSAIRRLEQQVRTDIAVTDNEALASQVTPAGVGQEHERLTSIRICTTSRM